MSCTKGRRNFHHPYEPYEIQQDFMDAVYDCLQQGRIGIFESPTGTGKSLSLICGSLTWLRDHKRARYTNDQHVDSHEVDEPQWMIEHARDQAREQARRSLQELNERISKIQKREMQIKERYESNEPSYKRQKRLTTGESHHQAKKGDEDRFMLEDYYDNTPTIGRSGSSGGIDDTGLSNETRALMQSLGYSQDGRGSIEEFALNDTKVIVASRTHSQLSQFANELRRVKIPPSIPTDDQELTEDIKYLTLGSRKNLCINDKVRGLGNATAINERCIELQQNTSRASQCQYMPTKEHETLLHDFRDHAYAQIRDIEDLGRLGKRLDICPYYASRPVAESSEIITLPYPLLLQKAARAALGISLKGHVVIIDEAHNLMDAIAGIYSTSVSNEQVQQARAQLTAYLKNFRHRLKGQNRVFVAQVLRILDSITSYLHTISTTAKGQDGVADMVSIMSGKGVDQIDMFELYSYLQQSNLARKVDGYTAFQTAIEQDVLSQQADTPIAQYRRQDVPVLLQVQSFLLSLTNPSPEGRFFFSKGDTDDSITLKYMLLDPTFHFKDIVEEARAVILAGGTMSPMSDYEDHLLSYLQSTKIMTISCGHVIPRTSLQAIPVVRAPDGLDFDFTFESRSKDKTILNLGMTLISFSTHVPDGVVIFFPSYAYLDTCIAAWKRQQLTKTISRTIWDELLGIKPIYMEQRSQQKFSQPAGVKDIFVESVLAEYSAAILSGNGRGALLFAVIGGSLSEGINFSDALGRCVVVVGLPFPNPSSAEWKAKLQYISSKENRMGHNGQAAAKDFFENTCMRAVNQCIGRAIRHKGDYAAIALLDRRYGTKRIQDKLPKWIRESLLKECDTKKSEQMLENFFSTKT